MCIWLVQASACFAGLAASGIAAPDALPPVRAFARAPQMSMASLSPDGAMLAYVTQSDAGQRVMLRHMGGNAERIALQLDPVRARIRWCGWSGIGRLLCGAVTARRLPDRVIEQTRLHVITVSPVSSRLLDLRLRDPVQDQVIDLLPDDADHVLLQHDEVGQGYPMVSRLNILTGALLAEVPARAPVRRWMSDGRGRVRLGLGFRRGVGSVVGWNDEEGAWRTLAEDTAGSDGFAPLAFGAAANELYVLQQHHGRAALFRRDLRRGESQLLFSHPVYDIEGPVLLDPATRELEAVQYQASGDSLEVFSAKLRRAVQRIDGELPARTNLPIDRSLDGRWMLVLSLADIDPPSLYLFDAHDVRLTLLGHQYPELEGRALSRMRQVKYPGRDGQAIPAFLTIPPGREGPLPAIVLPHGGPEQRDVWTYHALVQFLASRGYAVLQPNFRGSSGYGARFAQVGAGQWGGVVHNDITDGARWLVEQRIADPQRTCIVGASFGGYAALLAAVREFHSYACAVSYGGVSDLMALRQYSERSPFADIWQERLGTESRVLWQMSPLARVEMVGMPVLLIHGRSDSVVPVQQSRRFANALRRAGKPHEFVERPDCDHDMTVETCRLAYFEMLERFLAGSVADPPGR